MATDACGRFVSWWDGEYEGNCELPLDHDGPHYDGLSWFDDDGDRVDEPTDPLVHCQRCSESMPPPRLLEHVRLMHPDVDVEPLEAAVSEINFWHVNYATLNRNGMYVYSTLMARDQLEARAMARMESERHGHATITNRAGLVATFVGGREVREDQAQESGS